MVKSALFGVILRIWAQTEEARAKLNLISQNMHKMEFPASPDCEGMCVVKLKSLADGRTLAPA